MLKNAVDVYELPIRFIIKLKFTLSNQKIVPGLARVRCLWYLFVNVWFLNSLWDRCLYISTKPCLGSVDTLIFIKVRLHSNLLEPNYPESPTFAQIRPNQSESQKSNHGESKIKWRTISYYLAHYKPIEPIWAQSLKHKLILS